MKKCVKCSLEKNEPEFVSYNKNGKLFFRNYCKKCDVIRVSERYHLKKKEILLKKKNNYISNKEEILLKNKKWRDNNKIKLKEYGKNYYNSNKDDIIMWQKNYRNNNKEKIRKQITAWERNKRKTDPIFRVRKNISRLITKSLKNDKIGYSVFNFLSYTTKELRNYLESKFDTWMSWNNYGKYNKNTWNDSDQSTWTWNIDHIIPQSFLPFNSMEEENFQKCWSLTNLRPYSAKQNLIDSNRRNL